MKKQLQTVVIWSWKLDLDPRVKALQLVDRRTVSAARLCVSVLAGGSIRFLSGQFEGDHRRSCLEWPASRLARVGAPGDPLNRERASAAAATPLNAPQTIKLEGNQSARRIIRIQNAPERRLAWLRPRLPSRGCDWWETSSQVTEKAELSHQGSGK